jgi:diacylglycerol kinase (ATP)
MTNKKPNSIGSRFQSVAYALKGLRHLLKYEPNALIHLISTIAVIIAGIITDLNRVEWIAISIAIGLVWIAEAFNTCIELLCDLYTKEYNKDIGIIKDISAGAVLLASITALATGIIVFFF